MARIFATAATLGLALAAAFSAAAEAPSDRAWMWQMGWGWGGMLFGTLAMLFVVAVVVVLAVLLVRWLGGAPRPEAGEPRRAALDILQERFAKGEIDRQEYEERKRVLKGGG